MAHGPPHGPRGFRLAGVPRPRDPDAAALGRVLALVAPGTPEHRAELVQIAAVWARALMMAMAPDLTGERDPRPSVEIVREAVLARLEVQGG